MGIVEFDQSRYEMDYVPQRLRALEVCILACHSVLTGKVGSTRLTIDLGSSQIKQDDLQLFVDLAIDAGLVANRTLLNFMGMKLENGGIVNANYALNISAFGLQLIPVASAQKVLLPQIPELEMRRLWTDALSTASKSIAHFTEKGATISVARLGYACFGTSELVRKDFYDALGKAAPVSMLNPEVQPRFGTCWDSVDPGLNRFC